MPDAGSPGDAAGLNYTVLTEGLNYTVYRPYDGTIPTGGDSLTQDLNVYYTVSINSNSPFF